MFHAHAAAMRSAALGRQVGATIATAEGEIVSVGTNEVPKSGGGQISEGDLRDARDFVLGHDSSDRLKRSNLGELLEKLSKIGGWLAADKIVLSPEDRVRAALPVVKVRGYAASRIWAGGPRRNGRDSGCRKKGSLRS